MSESEHPERVYGSKYVTAKDQSKDAALWGPLRTHSVRLRRAD